ncbi:MAG: hypothetical protein MJZ30_06030 [Paludibacteraceae bacterium]|nr:hypothetical protein [Paludibacteraceae bacterium]
MTLREYCIGAGNTDQITDEQAKKGYYYLGLCGEAAETSEKIANEASRQEIAKECGDSVWYIVRLMYKLKGLESILNEDVDTVITSCPEKITPQDAAVALMITSGKIAERYKKVVRDRDGLYAFSDVQGIFELLLKALQLANILSLTLGYKFSEVLEMNLAKLASRQARNMIHGSGDNR